MNDIDFLYYMEMHCRSERALFNKEQAARLATLAKAHFFWQTGAEWASLHPDYVDPLVADARRYLGYNSVATLEPTIEPNPIKERQCKTLDPIPMVLHCPRCSTQHIDEAETIEQFLARWQEVAEYERITGERTGTALERWTNPPHKSHLCHNCGTIWRVADVPTNGVKSVGVGEKDTWKPSIFKETKK